MATEYTPNEISRSSPWKRPLKRWWNLLITAGGSIKLARWGNHGWAGQEDDGDPAWRHVAKRVAYGFGVFCRVGYAGSCGVLVASVALSLLIPALLTGALSLPFIAGIGAVLGLCYGILATKNVKMSLPFAVLFAGVSLVLGMFASPIVLTAVLASSLGLFAFLAGWKMNWAVADHVPETFVSLSFANTREETFLVKARQQQQQQQLSVTVNVLKLWGWDGAAYIPFMVACAGAGFTLGLGAYLGTASFLALLGASITGLPLGIAIVMGICSTLILAKVNMDDICTYIKRHGGKTFYKKIGIGFMNLLTSFFGFGWCYRYKASNPQDPDSTAISGRWEHSWSNCFRGFCKLAILGIVIWGLIGTGTYGLPVILAPMVAALGQTAASALGIVITGVLLVWGSAGFDLKNALKIGQLISQWFREKLLGFGYLSQYKRAFAKVEHTTYVSGSDDAKLQAALRWFNKTDGGKHKFENIGFFLEPGEEDDAILEKYNTYFKVGCSDATAQRHMQHIRAASGRENAGTYAPELKKTAKKATALLNYIEDEYIQPCYLRRVYEKKLVKRAELALNEQKNGNYDLLPQQASGNVELAGRKPGALDKPVPADEGSFTVFKTLTLGNNALNGVIALVGAIALGAPPLLIAITAIFAAVTSFVAGLDGWQRRQKAVAKAKLKQRRKQSTRSGSSSVPAPTLAKEVGGSDKGRGSQHSTTTPALSKGPPSSGSGTGILAEA